jgi:hypothetical protein
VCVLCVQYVCTGTSERSPITDHTQLISRKSRAFHYKRDEPNWLLVPLLTRKLSIVAIFVSYFIQ